MGASTTVTRTVSFRDEPDALLDYLVARTAETVGRRVERSNVVVLARVARTAVRALADERLPEGADALEEALPRVDDDLGVRLMLGLWTLGRRKRAIELLESEYAAAGRDAWLRRWGLAHSVDAKGQTEAVLFGP